jgi:hypothetical protein
MWEAAGIVLSEGDDSSIDPEERKEEGALCSGGVGGSKRWLHAALIDNDRSASDRLIR